MSERGFPILSWLNRLFSGKGKNGSRQFKAVDAWKSLSPQDKQRVIQRLERLAKTWKGRYGKGGVMDIPLKYCEENGVICLEHRSHRQAMSVYEASKRFSADEIDQLMRILLTQLMQLERIDFIHGDIQTKNLTIHHDYAGWSISLGGFHSGHFGDEKATAETLTESPWMSPETWAMMHYPDLQVDPSRSDIFSAACLYHTLLTGRAPQAGVDGDFPGAEASHLFPVVLRGVYGFRATLIHRMLTRQTADRPSAAEVLNILTAAKYAGYPANTALAIPSGALELRGATARHLPTQYLERRDDSLRMVRVHHWLWKPIGQLDQVFFRDQADLRHRVEDRLRQVCEQSRAWHKETPLIAVNELEAASCLLTASTFRGSRALTLDQLCRLHPSTFLLDARMTDILAALETLHASGYILGCFSGANFYADVTDHGASVYLADVSSAVPLEALPVPRDFCPEAEEIRLLSPELAEYISSGAKHNVGTVASLIGPSSDMFTLGLMYHRILTGSYPKLVNPGYFAYANALLRTGSPDQAFILSPQLDTQHRRLINHMLSLDPYKRPVSCNCIISSILNFYTG